MIKLSGRAFGSSVIRRSASLRRFMTMLRLLRFPLAVFLAVVTVVYIFNLSLQPEPRTFDTKLHEGEELPDLERDDDQESRLSHDEDGDQDLNKDPEPDIDEAPNSDMGPESHLDEASNPGMDRDTEPNLGETSNPDMGKSSESDEEDEHEQPTLSLSKKEERLLRATAFYRPPQRNSQQQAQFKKRPELCVSETSLTSCRDAGFGAHVLYTLDHIAACDYLGLPLLVKWSSCMLCGRPNGTNYWTNYFASAGPDESYAKRHGALCIMVTPDRANLILQMGGDSPSLADYAFQPSEKYEDIPGPKSSKRQTQQITHAVRRKVHRLLQAHVVPNLEIRQEVDTFAKAHFSRQTVVGVHIRGTDWLNDLSADRLLSLQDWNLIIADFVEGLSCESRKEGGKDNITIFVASDNDEAVQSVESHFKPAGHMVVSSNAVRAKRMNDDTWAGAFTDLKDGVDPSADTALGILKDILLLSRCDYMIHGEGMNPA